MTNKPTYDDANLVLRLYELRREETLRNARKWLASFSPGNPEHVQKVADRSSQENAYFRMVISYWDMAASFVTSGVLNEELFLQNSGEALYTWEKTRELIQENRKDDEQSPLYEQFRGCRALPDSENGRRLSSLVRNGPGDGGSRKVVGGQIEPAGPVTRSATPP
jgi:hypothetical protein